MDLYHRKRKPRHDDDSGRAHAYRGVGEPPRRWPRHREGEVFGAAEQRPAQRLRRGLLPGERMRQVRRREGEVFGVFSGRLGKARRVGRALWDPVAGGAPAPGAGASFSRPPLRIPLCPRLLPCLLRLRRLA